MSYEQYFGIVMLIIGVLSLTLRKFILKIQGTDEKKGFPINERSNRIIIGAVALIVIGSLLILGVINFFPKK